MSTRHSRAGTKRSTTSDGPEESDAKRRRTTDTEKDTKKDPKASHLYTDDNPETTLHGTGFKDANTANHTIELVSKRSMTYQFQTINTMLFRAKGHKHKTPGIEAAIKIFQEWTGSYKERKAALRSFPLLAKPKVKVYLEAFDNGDYSVKSDGKVKDAEAFARMYVDLGARKRLANTLVDNKHPEQEDWEIRRYKQLCALVEGDAKYEVGDLWFDERERVPTEKHLQMILWGYSPSRKT